MFLKIIFRTLLKNKLSTFIHILGLTLGLTCFFLIYMFIQHERSYDTYHQNAANTYRINWEIKEKGEINADGSVPNPVAESMRQDFEEITYIGRVYRTDDVIIKLDDKPKQKIDDVVYADKEIPNIFDFKTIEGDLFYTLSQPNHTAITASTAKKLFGRANPIGQKINIENKVDLIVSTLIEDTPKNTQLNVNLLTSYATLTEEFSGFPMDSWTFSFGAETYVVLPPNYTQDALNRQLATVSPNYMKALIKYGEDVNLTSQPLSDIHFNPVISGNSDVQPINPRYLWIFGIIGLLILGIACFNFINLSTAQAIRRSNEVGVRKVLGATQSQLITQYLGEAVMISCIAGVLSLALTEFSLPFVNELLENSIGDTVLGNPFIVASLFGIVLMTGLLSGIYPAFGLSSFKPIQAIRSKNISGDKSSSFLRKGIVVGQFTITLVLLISTFVISSQIKFLQNKDLGFNRQATMIIPLSEKAPIDIINQEIKSIPTIEDHTLAIGPPIANRGFRTIFTPSNEESDSKIMINAKSIDDNYIDYYGLDLIAGRVFNQSDIDKASPDLPKENRTYKYILNETTCKNLGYQNPTDILGETFTIGINNINTEVIGVVKDFHTRSLHNAIESVVFLPIPQHYYSASLRIDAANVQATIPKVKSFWEKQYPEEMFSYEFLDENIMELYEAEANLLQFFQLFAGIAIFIGCLGLWGLISFVVEQKNKEIGIRKVLGASVQNIIYLISNDFVKLILIAGVIAIPLAWYITNNWLANFEFHIHTPWLLFGLAIIIVTFAALMTMSFQTIRVANSNPVEALRDE